MIIEQAVYPMENTERRIIIQSVHDKVELSIKRGKITIRQDMVLEELPSLENTPIKKSFWEKRRELKQLKKELKQAEKQKVLDYDF